MWVDLVRMREAGQKRPKEDVLSARPERGRLSVKKANSSEVTYLPGEMESAAFFLVRAPDVATDIRHRLHKAVVSIVDDDSLMVVGIERIHLVGGRTQDYAQAWWCRLAGEPSASLGDSTTVTNGGLVVAAAMS